MAPKHRIRVCPTPGCHQLVTATEPCTQHGRPQNAPWSKDRDRAQQHQFRIAVLARDGNRCQRCGTSTRLVAHHVRPGYEPSAGITLCRACHRKVDGNAR